MTEDIDEMIAEYRTFDQARQRIKELGRTIANWVASPDSAHLSDDEVAEMIGWMPETVTRSRAASPTAKQERADYVQSLVDVLGYQKWLTAVEVARRAGLPDSQAWRAGIDLSKRDDVQSYPSSPKKYRLKIDPFGFDPPAGLAADQEFDPPAGLTL